MLELNQTILLETNEVFKRLNILRRWTSFVTENKYNELAKQALNCITVYLLASHCESNGQSINWEAFPKIALYRAFQKVYVYFDTPENIINEICSLGNIDKEQFNIATKDIITEQTTEEFMKFISSEINTYEFRLYRAATKIATYIELLENRSKVREATEYDSKLKEVLLAIEEFSDIPGINDFIDANNGIFKVLKQVSKLRNQNRWSVMPYSIECSVLGHLFDTGIFAYFIALEKYPGDEAIASKFFFMGIFHDIAEVWTTDIPSPIKDRIPGFRKDTELYEEKVLNKNLYHVVPPCLVQKLQNVMFEDESNLIYKKLIKGADYLSADSECWRQYIAGSRDPYYIGAMQRFDNKLVTGEKAMLTPECRKLHDYLFAYAKNLNL